MGPGHTMTMSGQGLLLLAVNWDFRPFAALRILKVGRRKRTSLAGEQPKPDSFLEGTISLRRGKLLSNKRDILRNRLPRRASQIAIDVRQAVERGLIFGGEHKLNKDLHSNIPTLRDLSNWIAMHIAWPIFILWAIWSKDPAKRLRQLTKARRVPHLPEVLLVTATLLGVVGYSLISIDGEMSEGRLLDDAQRWLSWNSPHWPVLTAQIIAMSLVLTVSASALAALTRIASQISLRDTWRVAMFATCTNALVVLVFLMAGNVLEGTCNAVIRLAYTIVSTSAANARSSKSCSIAEVGELFGLVLFVATTLPLALWSARSGISAVHRRVDGARPSTGAAMNQYLRMTRSSVVRAILIPIANTMLRAVAMAAVVSATWTMIFKAAVTVPLEVRLTQLSAVASTWAKRRSVTPFDVSCQRVGKTALRCSSDWLPVDDLLLPNTAGVVELSIGLPDASFRGSTLGDCVGVPPNRFVTRLSTTKLLDETGTALRSPLQLEKHKPKRVAFDVPTYWACDILAAGSCSDVQLRFYTPVWPTDAYVRAAIGPEAAASSMQAFRALEEAARNLRKGASDYVQRADRGVPTATLTSISNSILVGDSAMCP